jgi:DNA-binding CsgD family transcriptional regulator
MATVPQSISSVATGYAQFGRMKIKPRTVEDYRKIIGDKTGARTRVDMIHFVRRFGLG